MDIHCYILGIVLTLFWHCNAVLHKDLDERFLNNVADQVTTGTIYRDDKPNNLSDTKTDTGSHIKRTDVDSYKFNMGIGKRLWTLKQIVKRMDRKQTRRNILGILKDSVHNNLSNLLQHALNGDPPADYHFSSPVWKYTPDSSVWRNHQIKYDLSHSKQETREENIDPIMQWMGIGKRTVKSR